MTDNHTVTELLTACAWCERIKIGNRWIEEELAIERLRTFEWEQPPRFTHGICDPCLTALLDKRENARSPAGLTPITEPSDQAA